MIQLEDLTILGVGSLEKAFFVKSSNYKTRQTSPLSSAVLASYVCKNELPTHSIGFHVSKSGQTVLIENVSLCRLKQADAPAT